MHMYLRTTTHPAICKAQTSAPPCPLPRPLLFHSTCNLMTPLPLITRSITRACGHLDVLDQRVTDAVNVRQELDLRVGEALPIPSPPLPLPLTLLSPPSLLVVMCNEWNQQWAFRRRVFMIVLSVTCAHVRAVHCCLPLRLCIYTVSDNETEASISSCSWRAAG